MKYKYKLKEIEVGDVKVDNGTESTVTNINPTTGAITWSLLQVANIDRLLDESDDLVATAKGVYDKLKDDKKFLDIYNQARSLRNNIRAHTRSQYPEEYKNSRGVNEEEIDEMSTSGGAGGYLSKYAFKLPKKQKKIGEGVGATMGPGPRAFKDGVKDNYYVKKFAYTLVPKDKNGNYVQKGSGLEVNNF